MQQDIKSKFIPGKTRIKYGGAVVDDRELKAIQRVLDRNWWTLDEEGRLFEEELAKASSVRYALFANSGSSALLLAISSLMLPEGSEVIIPAVNFPTVASACLYNGLIPVYVDVDINSLCIDLDKAEKAVTKNTKAIVVVNIAGNTIDISRLEKFKRLGIITILDNCDGFGSTYKKKYVESYFDVSATSFHAAHIITTGEGGALFTNSKVYYKSAKSIREWGRADETDAIDVAKKAGLPKDYPGRYTYITKGFNLKPIELQAAMGRVQLKKIEKIKKARLENYSLLAKGVRSKSLPFIISTSPINTEISWFAFPMTLEQSDIRGNLRKFLEEKNIETRVIFAGNIIRQPAYKNTKYKKYGLLENADKVLKDSFFISVHPSVTKKMVSYILVSLENFFSKNERLR